MGAAASGLKTYRCPGCDQEIRPATPHVVSWPAYARDSDLDPWDTESAADLAPALAHRLLARSRPAAVSRRFIRRTEVH